jgi:hypothetical protein
MSSRPSLKAAMMSRSTKSKVVSSIKAAPPGEPKKQPDENVGGGG